MWYFKVSANPVRVDRMEGQSMAVGTGSPGAPALQRHDQQYLQQAGQTMADIPNREDEIRGPYTTQNIIQMIEDKNLEQVPQIKRLTNCQQLKRQNGEDILNYETRVKKYREDCKI